jgi:hypothetical protein
VVPAQVMTGAADVLANLALTAVQSMVEAPPHVEGQAVEDLLLKACHIACKAIADEAASKRPDLRIVPREPPQLSVIHNDGPWWCTTHKRAATHRAKNGKYRCDPNLGGILMMCSVVQGNGQDNE